VLARDLVIKLCTYVIDHFDKFAVDRDIYGDILQKYKHLRGELDGQP
jgi:hypothetical protein